jgi:hypothetical protein
VAKWIMDPVTKKPVRVSDEDAAQLVKKGGKYLTKSEAKRMLAGFAAVLVACILVWTAPGARADDLARQFRSSCEFWGNCYPRLRDYRQRQRDYRRADRDRAHERWATVREWEECRDRRGAHRCGRRPYAVVSETQSENSARPRCLNVTLEVVGGAAQTETGALNQAKRQMRAAIRAKYGETYQSLDLAQEIKYKCPRVSTNESVLGATAERAGAAFGFDTYQKRCIIRLRNPCQLEWETMKLQKDED